MTLRWLKRILLGVFLLMLALIASVSALVATEGGSHWVINRAVKMLPETIGTLELGELRGNLLTGLDVSYFDFQQVREEQLHQHYRAEQVSFRWQPLALLYSAVSVQSLQAENIHIVLPPPSGEPAADPFVWPSFALPVRIELGDVQLQDIKIFQREKKILELESINGSLSLGAFYLRATDLAVVSANYGVTVSGRTGVRFPYALDLQAEWHYQIPAPAEATVSQEPLRFSGEGNVRGDINELQVEHELLTPFVIESAGTFLPKLVREANEDKQSPYVELENIWSDQTLLARWFPANQIPPVTSAKINLSGWYDNYHALVDGSIAREDVGEFAVTGDARGNLQAIDIANLTVQQSVVAKDSTATNRITVKAIGQVVWLPSVNWNLALEASDINPAHYFVDWPGHIQLGVISKGSYSASGGAADKRLTTSIENINLTGQLRNLDVTGIGNLAYDGERWRSEQLRITLGANQINLAGSYSNQMDVQWQIEAPLLAQIDPQLTGSLSTRGSLQGTLTEPNIQVVAQAKKLQWQNYALDSLELNLSRGNAGKYNLALAANEVQLAAQHFTDVNLSGAGTPAQHDLQGSINSVSYGKVEFVLDSRYTEGKWQGKFSDIQLRIKRLPRWWLSSGDWIHVDAQQANIGEQCFTTRTNVPRRAADASGAAQTDAATTVNSPQPVEAVTAGDPTETPQLCLNGKWSTQTGVELLGKVTAVPLRQIRSWLKPDVALGGVIDGDVSFRSNQTAGTTPTGMAAKLQLQTRDGEMRYQFAGEEPSVYRWRSAQLLAELKADQLDASFVSDWAEYGSITASAKFNLTNQDLTGELAANLANLAPLEAIIPFADDVAGRLATDVSVQGKLQKPDVVGQLTLVNGSAKLPGLGVELREISMELSSRTGGNINLRSTIKSDKGRISLSGDVVNLGTPDWTLSSQLDGENFQIIKQQQLTANITPSINLVANAAEIRLTGDAKIPYARADIRALPATATRVSKDVIIIDDTTADENAVAGIPVFANINLELGKDVHFKGFGLDGKLIGKINIVQAPPRALLTTGYVSVEDGKYKAYGQELEIERGRLLFQGPYDNPGLDIRAVRKTPEYTKGVGIEIGGTLQQPTSTIIAEGLSASESMAILLTGKPLSEASAGEAYALYSALSGSGMNSGPGLRENITQALHVDELAIEADEGFEQSSLMVGKYLSPKLFVRYVVGLFDQAFSVGVSYQMTDRLRLEAESGEAQSIDIIYDIER